MATNRDAASQTVWSLTEIHICFLLSLFLSLLLMFSPENFQMNCVRPVKTASQLSYSPGAMQLPAHAHPRLLKVAVACWHLRQTLTLCSSESTTQNPRARERATKKKAHTLHMAKKERSPFNLRLCGSFWGTQSIFLAPITVSWQTDIYDPNSLCKHQ